MGVAATCRCLRLAGARAASKPLACSTAAARLHPPCVPAPGWCGFAALQRDKQCRQNIGKYRRKGWLVMREHASCAWECDVGGYAWARAGRPEARTCLGNVPSNPLALRCSRARCGAATTWVGGSRALAQAGWSMIVSACAASGCCGSCCWCCCASPRLHQALPQLEHFVLHLQQGVEEVLQERGGGGQAGRQAAAGQQPLQPPCQPSNPNGPPPSLFFCAFCCWCFCFLAGGVGGGWPVRQLCGSGAAACAARMPTQLSNRPSSPLAYPHPPTACLALHEQGVASAPRQVQVCQRHGQVRQRGAKVLHEGLRGGSRQRWGRGRETRLGSHAAGFCRATCMPASYPRLSATCSSSSPPPHDTQTPAQTSAPLAALPTS